GGLLVQAAAPVAPRLLPAALLRAAASAAVPHVPQRVARLRTTPGRAGGAELADGTVVSAEQVVLSAGWSSPAIAGLPPGAAPPLRPVKGQIVGLRPPAATALAGSSAVVLHRTRRRLGSASA